MNPAVLAQLLQQMRGQVPAAGMAPPQQSLEAPGMADTAPLRGPTMRADDPDFIQDALGPLDQEQEQLRRQMMQAEALMRGSGRQASTPLGAALGGLSDVLRAGVGAYRQGNLEREQRGLNLKRQELVDKAGKGPSARLVKALGASKAQKSTDPNSAESKRAQALLAAVVPGQFTDEQLAMIPEADADRLRADALAAQRIEAGRETEVGKTKRAATASEQSAKQFAEMMGFRWASLDQNQQLAFARLADSQAGREATAAARAGEVNVPGLEIAPGATPTKADAEKAKGVMESAGRLGRGIAEMRALHGQYGTEYGGKGGTRLKQALTSIALEAKNIAGLGALSGPDQGLMDALSGGDPSTIEASAKAFFGVDNTEEAMKGLEKWMSDQVAATLEARGYQKRSGPGAKTLPKSTKNPRPTTAKITVSNGTETLQIDAADLAEAEKEGFKRVGP